MGSVCNYVANLSGGIMNAKVRTILYELLILSIMALALGPMLIEPTPLGLVYKLKATLIVAFAVCPYVFVLMIYALVPLWRPLKSADFVQMIGIGSLGLLWTAIFMPH